MSKTPSLLEIVTAPLALTAAVHDSVHFRDMEVLFVSTGEGRVSAAVPALVDVSILTTPGGGRGVEGSH